jgi:hypothetical protein
VQVLALTVGFRAAPANTAKAVETAFQGPPGYAEKGYAGLVAGIRHTAGFSGRDVT